MIYFAYGSNMDRDRITSPDRAPSAQFLARAVLPDYELRFTRHSRIQNTGTADIRPKVGSLVWGVVFDLAEKDRPKLDTAEGVASGAYRAEESLTVFLENDRSRPVRVLTYLVCKPVDTHHPPAPWYLDHLIKGATRFGLPADYAAHLRQFPTLS